MKILMLNYEFPPLGGGTGNANYYLLKEFAKDKRIKIDLITSSISGFKKEKFSSNINIYYLNIAKNKNKIHYQTTKDLLIYSFKAYFFARRLIKKNNYDLIHAWFGIPCGFLALLLREPYIVSLRGSDVPFYNQRFEVLDKFLFKHLSKIIWEKAKATIALSKDLANLARKTSRDQKISIVYNGINIKEFFPNKKVLSREKTFNILFVGRLIERKGLIYLLKAFENLTKKYTNLKLIVVGDGPLKKKYINYALKRGFADKVKFLGIIKHNEMSKIYQRSHIFVLPSLNEALGNVTHEALASGLPIITTKTGATELLKDNGFIVRKKSFQDIKISILNYLENKNLLIKHSFKSRKLAEKMNWGKVANQYTKIYRSIKK
jgi:L-malate glycosyltransferase